MSIALDRRCRFSQEIFLTLHKAEVVFDETYHDWGLSWKHVGAMGSISRQPERAEAVAIASLYIHWWLTGDGGRNPGRLMEAAWFFYNPDEFRQARELYRNDPDAEPMFAFVEQQLSMFAN